MFLCGSHSQLSGPKRPDKWEGFSNLGDENDVITVNVNNVLTEKRIHNVFGVIKGFVDPGKMKLEFKERDVCVCVWRKWSSGTPLTLSRPLCGYRRPEGRVGPGLRCVNRRHQRPGGAGPLHL